MKDEAELFKTVVEPELSKILGQRLGEAWTKCGAMAEFLPKNTQIILTIKSGRNVWVKLRRKC